MIASTHAVHPGQRNAPASERRPPPGGRRLTEEPPTSPSADNGAHTTFLSSRFERLPHSARIHRAMRHWVPRWRFRLRPTAVAATLHPPARVFPITQLALTVRAVGAFFNPCSHRFLSNSCKSNARITRMQSAHSPRRNPKPAPKPGMAGPKTRPFRAPTLPTEI